MKAALEAHRARIHSLAMVQDEMYDPDRATLVNARNYGTGLIHHLLSLHGLTTGVDLKLDLDDLALTPRHAFVLGLVLNELVVCLAEEPAPGHPWQLGFGLKAGGPGSIELVVTESLGTWKRLAPRGAPNVSWALISALASHHQGTLVWTPEAPGTLTIRLA